MNHYVHGASACVAFVATIMMTTAVSAQVERYAVIVGNNRGARDEVTLQFAENDALKVQRVLRELGGFRPENVVLLQNESATTVRRTLISMNDRVRSRGRAVSAQSILFVYYSGHADAESLHLGDSSFDLGELEQLVRGSAAGFRFLVLDSCRSGSLTRVKGGRTAPPFAIRLENRLAGEGAVFLTSSAADEDAQESVALRGSFFTHYFVSGLLGAADVNRDGQVTLSEAYRYAYQSTLRASSRTLAGSQHPTFRYELAGRGDVVLTAPGQASSQRGHVSFPAGRTYLVFEGTADGAVVGEIGASDRVRQLSLRAGRYFVRGRGREHLLEGEITVAVGSTLQVDDSALHRVEYARLVRKGEGTLSAAHSIAAGYWLRTALHEGASLCQGGFAGYALDLESVSVGARGKLCRGSFHNEDLSASIWEYELELVLSHAWDLPVVTLQTGVTLGGALLTQRFRTTGAAPERTSGAAHVGVMLGLSADLFSRVFVSAEFGARTYFFEVQDYEQSELTARFAVLGLFGLGVHL